jgi:cell wall-associated NlpC family hydrolase
MTRPTAPPAVTTTETMETTATGSRTATGFPTTSTTPSTTPSTIPSTTRLRPVYDPSTTRLRPVYDPSTPSLPPRVTWPPTAPQLTSTPRCFAYNHADWYVNDVLTQAAAHAGNGQARAGCTVTPLPADVAGAVIRFALAQIGKPYVFGATGPDAYDCSRLTMASYRAAGIAIPRTAAAQWATLTHIDPGKLAMADLIYFDVGPDRPGIDHCGIVYDPAAQSMIVARHTGTNIQIQSYAGIATVGFARPAGSGTG